MSEQKMEWTNEEIDVHVDELVQKALVALEKFESFNQETVDYIVAKCSVAGLDQHGVLAEAAVKETGRGVFEDKAVKNLFACEYVTSNLRHLKTVGIISEDPLTGITEIAEPVGVICGIIPTTNPTSTVIFKSLIALKTRNPIIFSFHPSAYECSVQAATVIRDAAIAAGAPEDCIQWLGMRSMYATSALMNHKGIATILATGGNAMVKAAYSCGKPALGVGAGNVPAYVEKTCVLKRAVNDIVLSKSFDNGMICASEQAAIVDEEIYQDFKDEMCRFKVYFANEEEKAKLENYMFGCTAYSDHVNDAHLNPAVVGKPVTWIAQQAGFVVPEDTQIICAECQEVGPNEPLTREKLSPVLAVLKATSTEDGIEKSAAMVEFNGLGHSAAIHTQDHDITVQFGLKCKAIRVIENAPSTFGGIGSVYNAFIPSLTLGCGSYGHNSVSNNVSAINLLNIKRIGRRNNNMQWVKLPPKVYFEKNSIKYLRDMKEMEKAMIITDRGMYNLGYVAKIEDVIRRRRNKVDLELFFDVEPDPSIDTVNEGVELMRKFQPDTIIALGGGSSMDAAKVMWLMYEHPEVNFDDIKQKFMDIRKRAFKFPELGKKASLICIPTTSGTGSEVTPFAVITDKAANKKYPLTDYSLTPTVAIVDPEFAMSMPASIASDTGIDVLTHAIEAYVSILASDFTDGLAKQAVKLVFDYLERSVKNGKNDPEAREKMHNAGTIAGMAFANAFLGMNHSLAHKIGGEWHVPHGRTNGILLPHVIRYNGTIPTKLNIWPKIENYKADIKYMELAQLIGLNPKTPAEGVEMFADACEELCKKVGVPCNIKSQGIDADAWEESVHRMAMNAYEDQCTPANPRMPMVHDMEAILRTIYDYESKF
ncbi:MAG: bifunctional acetaldehyde-CoA/alcohol dehydrogenase [Turicibacter sanguinis]|jgi:aldehyde-alcohol dehydrogenase 2|uniref:Aldehyde-alcohol dehydrogenase n=2 Tax=Turicibacter sanguinis TaxID=154288 RepID=A0A9X5AP58_9FIRM|nr:MULTISPECIES: bifunctional acetaldehyde-CoA/alcohol dehydrogenase [Turicibacter]KAB6704361.1 bifunctional acetaldehyde-CoA/alcohol dehydrogenase [Phocaeicola vulgatus]EFF64772.1 aldehyde-alcohol dehydrogenase 2 [Turicibacter sanguinis PC909]EGC92172.1 aldehyde-alcohol dehydrogenase 2 [Turicibacter sp. HGF1]MBP3905068.1 bifunctional acetaldehyde-CoA/alcohol dehydrogenase [Turicibacter sp.]MCU7190248.1 bifunctional acetaldehyde-CoA/alcohol dehydrogenase [Turicibacter sanguinis]